MMSNFPSEILSSERIESIEQAITEEACAGQKEAAWRHLQPLRKAQHHQQEAASSLLRIIGQQCVPKAGAADPKRSNRPALVQLIDYKD
jgi:hypothetical protein